MFKPLFVCLLAGPALASAASLSVDVTDAAGVPLADAVVYAEPVSGQVLPRSARRTVEIEQRKRRFNPLVTVVQVGTEINFPNNDTVKHHVYSFSPAKVFDLPLYSGTPAAPQLFDKAGTVVLGCNIHDQMIAYVEVVDTPFFGKTDVSGKLRLDALPPGKYQLRAWHYNLPISVPFVEQGLTMAGDDGAASFKLELKPGAGSN
ncbi:MAG TPA: methylamine utilization protein [Burkholderiaceae bacterium]